MLQQISHREQIWTSVDVQTDRTYDRVLPD